MSARILCVDDEANVLKSLRRLLMDEDYEIFLAGSGAEGLQLLEENAPIHLVISDYRMPEMNGVEFLKQVYERWPETVRIVLSGYADTASIVSAINDGQIYKFIPKPWNDDELLVNIANAIERYFLQAENLQLTSQLQSSNDELKQINEDLERMVEERTAELMFQNRVLTVSQHILDTLPVAVVGFDLDGMVVNCNTSALQLFGHSPGILGRRCQDVMPPAINSFMDGLSMDEVGRSQLDIDGRTMMVLGKKMNFATDQQGGLLVFMVSDG